MRHSVQITSTVSGRCKIYCCLTMAGTTAFVAGHSSYLVKRCFWSHSPSLLRCVWTLKKILWGWYQPSDFYRPSSLGQQKPASSTGFHYGAPPGWVPSPVMPASLRHSRTSPHGTGNITWFCGGAQLARRMLLEKEERDRGRTASRICSTQL